jgi:hypothetical protein
MRADAAPRPVMLALFYVSRWGASDVNSHAAHAATVHAAHAAALQRQLDELRAELARLARLGDFGAANDPESWSTTVARPPSRVEPARPHDSDDQAGRDRGQELAQLVPCHLPRS